MIRLKNDANFENIKTKNNENLRMIKLLAELKLEAMFFKVLHFESGVGELGF